MEIFHELINELQLAGIELKQGELMCRHTTFSIGGSVSLMVIVFCLIITRSGIIIRIPDTCTAPQELPVTVSL